MWICPKCGREFKNASQNHFCGEPEKTIDAYIAEQPESIQTLLNQVRDAIRTAIPDAEERISWRMPTFWKKHNIIHFAAFKNHIGLYPGDKAVTFFADRLSDFKKSKGDTVSHITSDPLNLIAKIAKWCMNREHP